MHFQLHVDRPVEASPGIVKNLQRSVVDTCHDAVAHFRVTTTHPDLFACIRRKYEIDTSLYRYFIKYRDFPPLRIRVFAEGINLCRRYLRHQEKSQAGEYFEHVVFLQT